VHLKALNCALQMHHYYYYLPTINKTRVQTRQGTKRLQRLLVLCSLCRGKRPHSPAEWLRALKQENSFPGILGDDCGASANFLYYLNGHVHHSMCLLSLWQQGRRWLVCLPIWTGTVVLCRLMSCPLRSSHCRVCVTLQST